MQTFLEYINILLRPRVYILFCRYTCSSGDSTAFVNLSAFLRINDINVFFRINVIYVISVTFMHYFELAGRDE